PAQGKKQLIDRRDYILGKIDSSIKLIPKDSQSSLILYRKVVEAQKIAYIFSEVIKTDVTSRDKSEVDSLFSKTAWLYVKMLMEYPGFPPNIHDELTRNWEIIREKYRSLFLVSAAGGSASAPESASAPAPEPLPTLADIRRDLGISRFAVAQEGYAGAVIKSDPSTWEKVIRFTWDKWAQGRVRIARDLKSQAEHASTIISAPVPVVLVSHPFEGEVPSNGGDKYYGASAEVVLSSAFAKVDRGSIQWINCVTPGEQATKFGSRDKYKFVSDAKLIKLGILPKNILHLLLSDHGLLIKCLDSNGQEVLRSCSLTEINDVIDEVYGFPVLFHCYAGASRSAFFTICLSIRYWLNSASTELKDITSLTGFVRLVAYARPEVKKDSAIGFNQEGQRLMLLLYWFDQLYQDDKRNPETSKLKAIISKLSTYGMEPGMFENVRQDIQDIVDIILKPSEIEKELLDRPENIAALWSVYRVVTNLFVELRRSYQVMIEDIDFKRKVNQFCRNERIIYTITAVDDKNVVQQKSQFLEQLAYDKTELDLWLETFSPDVVIREFLYLSYDDSLDKYKNFLQVIDSVIVKARGESDRVVFDSKIREKLVECLQKSLDNPQWVDLALISLIRFDRKRLEELFVEFVGGPRVLKSSSSVMKGDRSMVELQSFPLTRHEEDPQQAILQIYNELEKDVQKWKGSLTALALNDLIILQNSERELGALRRRFDDYAYYATTFDRRRKSVSVADLDIDSEELQDHVAVIDENYFIGLCQQLSFKYVDFILLKIINLGGDADFSSVITEIIKIYQQHVKKVIDKNREGFLREYLTRAASIPKPDQQQEKDNLFQMLVQLYSCADASARSFLGSLCKTVLQLHIMPPEWTEYVDQAARAGSDQLPLELKYDAFYPEDLHGFLQNVVLGLSPCSLKDLLKLEYRDYESWQNFVVLFDRNFSAGRNREIEQLPVGDCRKILQILISMPENMDQQLADFMELYRSFLISDFVLQVQKKPGALRWVFRYVQQNFAPSELELFSDCLSESVPLVFKDHSANRSKLVAALSAIGVGVQLTDDATIFGKIRRVSGGFVQYLKASDSGAVDRVGHSFHESKFRNRLLAFYGDKLIFLLNSISDVTDADSQLHRDAQMFFEGDRTIAYQDCIVKQALDDPAMFGSDDWEMLLRNIAQPKADKVIVDAEKLRLFERIVNHICEIGYGKANKDEVALAKLLFFEENDNKVKKIVYANEVVGGLIKEPAGNIVIIGDIDDDASWEAILYLIDKVAQVLKKIKEKKSKELDDNFTKFFVKSAMNMLGARAADASFIATTRRKDQVVCLVSLDGKLKSFKDEVVGEYKFLNYFFDTVGKGIVDGVQYSVINEAIGYFNKIVFNYNILKQKQKKNRDYGWDVEKMESFMSQIGLVSGAISEW
ncbi:MAG: hypothetical protein KAT71_04360, partial [Gammaproteobacteria bacterium]|nr:hypothetical protein [Gammaproteobacteria bacterium]